ncbi:MAG: hypothetical protein RLZZ570_1167, partial [Bacteroidota bacterium]
MNRILIFILIFSALHVQSAAQSFQERSTSASQVRLSVTNVGTFGNA